MDDTTGLVGAKVMMVRPMTKEEMDREGWHKDRHGFPTVICLDNGVILYPSRDSEGNGAGALFGYDHVHKQSVMF